MDGQIKEIIFAIQFYGGCYNMSLSQCIMCTEAQDISDNFMEGDNKIKHSTSGVNCALKLFEKSTATVHNECILPSLRLSLWEY